MLPELNEHICEEAVFESIYKKYSQDLHNYLYYKYGDKFSPNDKVQDAFIKLWNNCKDVTFSKAKSFLFTVANNLMLNEIKHHKVVLKYQNENQRDFTNETPEFVLEKKQFLQRYQEVLGKMSEEQRVAFLLNKVEGKKHSEIADMLGITQKTVEYRIYSAFSILKKELVGFKIK
ncbi:sigma-70 family RNA polymerase sigma factor [Gaetbulibacter aquiaggeris]|uniref:Sigma-70 family RNA polymerase sigma factor n=1 Tax=Gaetbulibacter aquiaggeris TaxID=1735373 RepID=A0ABW7MTC3_9FLAO